MESDGITEENVSDYGFEIADMISILNNDYSMFTNTFDNDELSVVTKVSEEIKQMLAQLGVDEATVRSIYQSCHDSYSIDYMCVVERLGN